MKERLERTAEALRKRGFEALMFSTAKEASDFIRQDIAPDAAVGIGGSMTVKQLGLHDALRADGHTVLWHWEAPAKERPSVLRAAMNASVYLCSANALTEDGLIVQIDGNGNRIAAICYGPSTVYLLVGRNKLVQGGLQDAVRRIKQTACPQNARRMGLDTPCAHGACVVSSCKRPMCHITMALELAPSGKRTVVALIDEDLGY